MKHTHNKVLLFLIFLSLGYSTHLFSQPSWIRKAAKSVFTLKTFDREGALLASSTGIFTSSEGTCISSFSPFKGATKAVVIDAQGKEYEVTCMLGANEAYDVAKFQVSSKKTIPAAIANTATPIGQPVWLLPYRETKNAPQGSIRQVEIFGNHHTYYTVALTMPEETTSAPLLNAEGEVIGLMQKAALQGDTLSYAVSARFADSLAINGLSINDPTLRSTFIKKDLPTDVQQAVLTLYIAQASMDSTAYTQLLEDFINRFPNSPEGYSYRAQMLTQNLQFDAAAHDMEKAIKVAEKKDEAHFSYAKLIYQKEIYMSQFPYEGWSLDKALEESQKAEQINPLAVYRQQQANILYAQKNYQKASDIYQTLYNSELRSAEIFYEGSRCCAALKDTLGMMALLDSCVALYSKPYLREAAPYILARAQAFLDARKFRPAVNDLNEYEQIMPADVNANFYYLRFQAEIGGRLFQQALNDITQAIKMAPDHELYYAEKASLQVRVALYDEAIETAHECIRIAPDYSDGYLFLGLAQCLKGQKSEGIKNLTKAKDLGDPQAENLIEKYK
jgi:hypothetical protein